MNEKYLGDSEQEELYRMCIQVIKNRRLDLIPEIENQIDPFQLTHIKVASLLYYIYFIILQPGEKEAFYNLKYYIYEDLANLNIAETVRYYTDNIVPNAPKEERYLWDIAMLILKKFTNDAKIPEIDFDMANLPKLNYFIHKIKYQRIASFVLHMVVVWFGLMAKDDTTISEFDKMRGLSNVYYIYATMPDELNRDNGDEESTEDEKERQIVEEAMGMRFIE